MIKNNFQKVISLLAFIMLCLNPHVLFAQAGGGDGISCFIAGTMVTMADGSTKPIEELKIGDQVKGQTQINTVTGIEKPLLGTRKLYSINASKGFVTSEHPFMTKEGWKSFDPAETAKENPDLKVGKLAVGDVLITLDGEVIIEKFKAISDSRDIVTYNPLLNGDNTYYADGYLVHNKMGDNCAFGEVDVCVEVAPSPGTEIQCHPTATHNCPTGQVVAVICGPSSGTARVCNNICVAPPPPPGAPREQEREQGGGGEGGGDCLAPNTLVRMEDGTTKRLDAIKNGDRVKADNGVINTVKGVLTKEWDVLVMYSINNGELLFTIDHPVMTNNGWKAIDYSANPDAHNIYGLLKVGTLEVGDYILTNNGEVEVQSIDPAPPAKDYTTYNLKLDGSRSFYANGVLVRSN